MTEDEALAEAIVDAAWHYLDAPPVGYNDDCSGYVGASFNRAGVPLRGRAAAIWEAAESAGTLHHRKLPSPGDVAFWDNTYDRNKDGRWNDALTHVGIVLRVDEKTGDILLGHGGFNGTRDTFRMNLYHPDDHLGGDGRVINDSMRKPRKGDPKSAQYLGSQLWAGFATYRERDRAAWLGDAVSDAER